MHDLDPQPRVAVQHAPQDEMIGGDHLLHRVAHGIDHEEGREAHAIGKTQRMQHHRRIQLFQPRPERVQRRVGKFHRASTGVDLKTLQPEALHPMGCRGNGQIRRRHRQCAKARKGLGIGRAHRRHMLILQPAQLVEQSRLGPVMLLARGGCHHLVGDAHLRHIRQPALDLQKGLQQIRKLVVIHHPALRRKVALIGNGGQFGPAGHQRVHARAKRMGMGVNRHAQ